eukprot:1156212-Pelagomonas_calceolata.AAC.1
MALARFRSQVWFWLQFYWFKSTVKMYNGLLNSNSETLRRVLNADLHGTHGRLRVGLLRSWMAFKECGTDFTDDLRHRLRDVWRDVQRVDP